MEQVKHHAPGHPYILPSAQERIVEGPGEGTGGQFTLLDFKIVSLKLSLNVINKNGAAADS